MLHKAQNMPDVLDGLFNTYFIIFFVYGVLMIKPQIFSHTQIHTNSSKFIFYLLEVC